MKIVRKQVVPTNLRVFVVRVRVSVSVYGRLFRRAVLAG